MHNDLISCKSDARCNEHKYEDISNCSKCTELKQLVNNFQTHKCTFSCQKKKRILKVHANEGLGRDQNEPSDEFVVKLCRYKFPRYPLDKLEIVRRQRLSDY